MSDHSLPKTVDPLKYADQNKVLEGIISVALMPRLLEIVASPTGEVEVALEFDRDEQRLRVLKGTLSATLSLSCERCLEPVTKIVESQFQLGIVVSDEQAKNLPGYYEPLLVESESIALLDVIEEELILSLPMFAYHSDCKLEHSNDDGSDDAQQDGKKPNPFSVLSELKLKK
jgi:DUF177 domain-containing protein